MLLGFIATLKLMESFLRATEFSSFFFLLQEQHFKFEIEKILLLLKTKGTNVTIA